MIRSASGRGTGPAARSMLAGLLSVACAAAAAQSERPMRAESADGSGLGYRSALAGYRPYGELAVSPWREVNDEVGRIGGWRVYARQARQPQPAEPARPGDPAGRKESKP